MSSEKLPGASEGMACPILLPLPDRTLPRTVLLGRRSNTGHQLQVRRLVDIDRRLGKRQIDRTGPARGRRWPATASARLKPIIRLIARNKSHGPK